MKYNTVVIDFPWPITLAGHTKLRPNFRKELPYKTMTLEEIENFPLKDYAEIGAHVYIWFPNRYMPDFPNILETLGVNFHLILPWVKPNGKPPMLSYKFASEFCILGFYGKPMIPFNRDEHNKPIVKLNWIFANSKRNTHSQKPKEMYELIKSMSPEPRIDIFARQRHVGFDAWGDQVEPMLQTTLLNEVTTS